MQTWLRAMKRHGRVTVASEISREQISEQMSASNGKKGIIRHPKIKQVVQ